MAVRLEAIRKTYRGPDQSVVPILDIPSFELATATQTALLGSSGSGKTTLLHVMAGIVVPDSGRVVYRTLTGEVELTSLSEAQRDRQRGRLVGYVFQTHHLLGGFSALENVLLGMSFTGRQPDRAWAEHLLETVGLRDRLHYKPGKLSLGQQQRVAVARALANKPALVLADEPTGSLDARNAQQVLDLILKLCTEAKAALLLVTHDAHIASQLPARLELAEINRAADASRVAAAAVA